MQTAKRRETEFLKEIEDKTRQLETRESQLVLRETRFAEQLAQRREALEAEYTQRHDETRAELKQQLAQIEENQSRFNETQRVLERGQQQLESDRADWSDRQKRDGADLEERRLRFAAEKAAWEESTRDLRKQKELLDIREQAIEKKLAESELKARQSQAALQKAEDIRNGFDCTFATHQAQEQTRLRSLLLY